MSITDTDSLSFSLSEAQSGVALQEQAAEHQIKHQRLRNPKIFNGLRRSRRKRRTDWCKRSHLWVNRFARTRTLQTIRTRPGRSLVIIVWRHSGFSLLLTVVLCPLVVYSAEPSARQLYKQARKSEKQKDFARAYLRYAAAAAKDPTITRLLDPG